MPAGTANARLRAPATLLLRPSEEIRLRRLVAVGVRELTGDQLSERIELAGRALYYGARSGRKQLTLDQRITLRGAVHMLSRGEDYAFTRPSLVREKIRRAQLLAGAERRQGRRNPVRVFATADQHRLENQLAAQAETAYQRLVQDWRPTTKGAGAAPGRATRGPSSGQTTRQDTAPRPAL